MTLIMLLARLAITLRSRRTVLRPRLIFPAIWLMRLKLRLARLLLRLMMLRVPRLL